MKDFSLEMTLITSIQTLNRTSSHKPNLTARQAGNCRGESHGLFSKPYYQSHSSLELFFTLSSVPNVLISGRVPSRRCVPVVGMKGREEAALFLGSDCV